MSSATSQSVHCETRITLAVGDENAKDRQFSYRFKAVPFNIIQLWFGADTGVARRMRVDWLFAMLRCVNVGL